MSVPALAHEIKITHVIHHLGYAGTELGVIRQANFLVDSGFNVQIVCLCGYDAKAVAAVSAKVKVVALQRRDGFDRSLIRRLATIFRDHKTDVVYSHNWSTCLYAIVAARIGRVPVVIHGEHGRDTEQYEASRKRLYAQRALARFCDHLTAVSPDILEILHDAWKVPRWKLTQIPNGVDLEKYHPGADGSEIRQSLNIPNDAPILGTVVGWIRPVKDLPTLLEAFALLRRQHPGAHLVVLGQYDQPADRTDLESRLQQLQLTSSVHMLGQRTDIPRILSMMDVYVNSSLYEGMSNTILEAMACGVPVVATAVGGTPWLLQRNRNGLLVPPKNPQQMSQVLSGLLTDAAQQALLAKNGRRYVEEKHRQADTMTRYAELYRHLIHEKQHRRISSTLKDRLKSVAGRTCSPLVRVARRIPRRRQPIFIINYHRVLPAHLLDRYIFPAMVQSTTVFQRQMEFFSRRGHVISLEECCHLLENQLPVPEHALVLTFDDGYKELFQTVKPVLERYHLPATIFLTTNYVEERTAIWFDAIGERLLYAGFEQHDLADTPKEFRSTVHHLCLLPQGRQRLPMIRSLVQWLARQSEEMRSPLLERLMRQDGHGNGATDNSLLNWSMIQEMGQNDLFTFGSHSHHHVRLDCLNREELVREIADSQVLLKANISRPAPFLAFPWGKYNEVVLQEVKAAGYRGALMLSHRPNYSGEDIYRLRRVDAGYLTRSHCYDEGIMMGEFSGINAFMRSLLVTEQMAD
jgi:sugar transferase (PEP-CTERM/EpsH1 system associated)